MKVIVTRKFKDIHTDKIHYKGEVLEISDERYQEIADVGNFVMRITENDTENASEEETHPDAPADAFDEMSIRELREYADKAYKLTFKGSMKKSEIIEELRRREMHG